jgi:HlyD family secretion protein
MTRKQLLLAAAILAASVAGGLVWMHPGQADNRADNHADPAILAPKQTIGIGALGRVEPASRVRKLNQAGGLTVTRLGRLEVQEGDRVTAGQLLAEFSDTTQKDAATAQAEASVRQADAALARIRAAGRPEDVQAQRERVEALRAAETSLVRDAARSDALGPSGATAIATVERNHFAAIRAKAERAEAEATLAKLQAPWTEDVTVAQAELAASRAALAKAQADAALSRVYAPIDGTVLKIYARPGDQVGTDGLLDMADLDHLDIVADVYETDLPRLREGAAAEVLVPGDPHRYAATVREIGWLVHRTTEANTDPVAATDARTVEVRLSLGEEGRAALLRRTNMQVQVAIRR